MLQVFVLLRSKIVDQLSSRFWIPLPAVFRFHFRETATLPRNVTYNRPSLVQFHYCTDYGLPGSGLQPLGIVAE
jgi:hypothetical protein